ncbi:MAG: enoyl-CoA hydratase/isomerase family protein [Parahaliea sp.]
MSDEVVRFEEVSANQGRIGRIILNVPSTLNALTLPMVDCLQARLEAWRDDRRISLIFIEGSGDKAFCAGGDIQALYQSVTENPGGPCDYAEDFFEREYRMDYSLHTYPKPVVCWGHGIVMGGGLGVMAACTHRIVTESTRIAMPEVGIALFPDVGGSWFLNHMPGKVGRFLALTGAAINATDALFTGLADRFIAAGHKDTVLDALLRQRWMADAADNHALVRHILRPFAERSLSVLPTGQVEPHLATIEHLCDGDDIYQVIEAITAIETDDSWLARARDGLAYGSPLATLWIERQLQQTRDASLKEVFASELVLATNILRHPEFAEGVRALIIDKDRKPDWQYKTVRDVPAKVLDLFFSSPWPVNPLAKDEICE